MTKLVAQTQQYRNTARPAVILLLNSTLIATCLLTQRSEAQFAPPVSGNSLSPQITIAEADQETISQLQRAERYLAEQQNTDAIDTLMRISDAAKDQLITVASDSLPKGFATYFPTADEVQRRLAAMPADGLRDYRAQIDGEATTLFNQAQQAHSEQLLLRVGRQYLASSKGDDALLVAGDAALARGDVNAARRAWLALHAALRTSNKAAFDLATYPALSWFDAARGRPALLAQPTFPSWATNAEGTSLLPACPDASATLADVRARLIVASILEHNVSRATWELNAFRLLHPETRGRLAGRNGLNIDLLQNFFNDSKTWASREINHNAGETFAGNFQRNQARSTNVVIGDRPLWSAELPRLKSDRDVLGQGRLRVAERHDSLLSYFPSVFEGNVIVADEQRLRCWEVDSGSLAWEVLLRDQPSAGVVTNLQAGVPRYTTTVANGVAFVVLPTVTVPVRRAATVRREDLSRVWGIDLQSRKRVLEIVADDATSMFGLSPLIDRGRLYVSVRKQAEGSPQVLVDCYDIASGRKMWQRFVSSADSIGHGDHAEYAPGVLTLDHDTIYINTNLGCVAALAVDDGSQRWLTKYPRAAFPAVNPERSDRHVFRDMNPCLLHQGKVVCAPADCDRIFALDATSGHLIWTLPPGEASDAVHLLGARDGYILASGDYLYWINLLTGQTVSQFPEPLPIGPGLALPTPRGFGRGIIAGDNVYWPSESCLHVFSLLPKRTGAFFEPQLVERIELFGRGATGGNMIADAGHVLLATGEALYCFGPDGSANVGTAPRESP